MNNQYNQGEKKIKNLTLISSFWNAKLKILFTTIVFSLVSFIYTFNSVELWSVNTIIDDPKPHQLSQYNFYNELVNDGVKQLTINTALSQEEQGVNISAPVANNLPTTTELHQLFIAEFRKRSNQVYFLKKQPFFNLITNENELNSVTKDKYAYEWVKTNISFIEKRQNNKLNKKDGSKITITALTADEALVFSYKYLDFINDILIEKIRNQMSLKLNTALRQAVNNEQDYFIYKQLKIKQNIEQFERKINYLINSNISKKSPQEYVKKYEILAKEKSILEHKIAIMNVDSKSKNLPLINKWMKINLDIKLDKTQFYHLTEEPHYPLKSNKPTSFLVLIMGGLLGFMLSIIVVILSNANREQLALSK